MGHQPGPEQERLAALVGRWRTSGWTRATADAPALQIAATDTYEWLPGRFALLHSVDAHVGQSIQRCATIRRMPAKPATRPVS
jgi:hypothetical protein